MVQGINTQNYSVAQLKELQRAGVQGITDDDIKAAEKREAEETQESDDNAEVSYAIEDDASKVNEAQDEVKAAEDSGESLCNILETLIDKSVKKDSELKDVSKQLSEYELKMSDVMDETVELKADTEEELEEVKSETEDATKTVEEKQEEIKQKEEEINKLQSEIDANPDDKGVQEKQGKIDTLQGEVASLKSEVSSLQKDVSSKSKAEEMVKTAADVKMKLMGKTLDDVKGELTVALNKATDASEYADVTIEKGIEASDAKPKTFINKANGSLSGTERKRVVRNIMDSIFRRSKMRSLGKQAIVTGEHLGNSSVGIGKEVKQLGSQYSMTFAESSNIDKLTSKQYVDTSKMDSLQDPSKAKGFFGRIKVAVENQKVLDEIVEESKKKNKESEDKTSEA